MAKPNKIRDGWDKGQVSVALITDEGVSALAVRVFAYLDWWRAVYPDWPGVKQVAIELGTNARVIRRELQGLETAGYIKKAGRSGRSSSEYTLVSDPGRKLPGLGPDRLPVQKQHQAMVAALADLCEMALSAITDRDRGRMNQAARVLRDLGANPEDIARFREYWYAADWRGKKGYAPRPAQVRSEWGRAMSWHDDHEPDLPVY